MISPLLANVYRHGLDKAFYAEKGPARWANAKLVRYADDLVVLARHQSQGLVGWIEKRLEARMGLVINREKTRIVKLREAGSLDFLGFTFRYDLDLKGRGHRYLNVFPSEKALAREREKIRDMTATRFCFKPIPALIRQLNRHLRGWSAYFDFGYPRMAYRHINRYVRNRLVAHLERRSQRRYRPPEDVTFYRHLADLGLVYL